MKSSNVGSLARSVVLRGAAITFFASLSSCPHPAPTPDPPWHPLAPPPDDNVYFVMVDRFANGDPSNDGDIDPSDPQAWHGGDLRGVIENLAYLHRLGVQTVWLSPIFKSRTEKFFEWGAFHGYWVEDLSKVEPRFGTEADLRELSDKLHSLGMRLVLDLVMNHVAMDAPLVREKPGWFHQEGGIENWNDPNELVTHEVHGLPDLAQENEEVYQYLLSESLGWIDRVHPDGFRIDAVRHMSTDFLARFSHDVHARVGPDFLLLGEDFQGDALSLARTFRDGGFGAMFDFPLHYAMLEVYCDDKPVGRIAATLSADSAYDDPSRLVPFLDNHDLPRIWTKCHGDRDRVEQALTFLLTTRGIPALTYGTEAAMEGAGEPENRADMRFEDGTLADHIHRLLAFRNEHPALQGGVTRILALDSDFFAYARVAQEETVLIGVNRGETAARIPLLQAGMTDLLSGIPSEPVVPPGTTRVFRLQEPLVPHAATDEHRVHLTATSVPLAPGDELVLVGSGEMLANWNPALGLGPFRPTADGLVLDLPYPDTGVMEFKLVIRHPDGTVEWQADPNRYVFVDRDVAATVGW